MMDRQEAEGCLIAGAGLLLLIVALFLFTVMK